MKIKNMKNLQTQGYMLCLYYKMFSLLIHVFLGVKKDYQN